MAHQSSGTTPPSASGLSMIAIRWALRLFGWRPKPAPEPEKLPVAPPPPPPPPPEPKIVRPSNLEAFFGNIHPLPTECDPPPVDSPLRHSFPEQAASATRFEEFNRRLLVNTPAPSGVQWPNTRVSDFATVIEGAPSSVLAEARARLRPFYPVIYDPGGFWARASSQLEMDPEYTDPIVEAYLSIELARRPIVLSVKSAPSATGADPLLFMRYGFENFSITFQQMAPFSEDCLKSIMGALIGTPQDWMWFSVARMRKAVVENNRNDENLRAFLEQEAASIQDDEQRNRFAALWELRSVGTKTDADTNPNTTEPSPPGEQPTKENAAP